MPDYYASCGWAPFGWTKQKADNVGACGPFTTLNDQGECVIDASAAVGPVSMEYCRLNPSNIAVCDRTTTDAIKELPGCEDTFLTPECANSIAGVMQAAQTG